MWRQRSVSLVCGRSSAGEDLRSGAADHFVLIGVTHRLGGDRKLRLVCLRHRTCGDRHASELSSDEHFGLRQAEPQTRSAELGERRLVLGITACGVHD